MKDPLYSNDYLREEDPKYYISQKTGRGPLSENWIEEYWQEIKDEKVPMGSGKAIMCAYKLCKVEFRYWGMQTKIEKFIHDVGKFRTRILTTMWFLNVNVALRKTMLRAHRQAWAWQDEWHGLTMDDIREIERQTQLALKRKMGQEIPDDEDDSSSTLSTLLLSIMYFLIINVASCFPSIYLLAAGIQKEDKAKLAATLGSIEKTEDTVTPPSKKKNQVPVIQRGDSSGEHSPQDTINDYCLSR